MKKKLFLISGVAAIVLAGCSEKEMPSAEPETGKPSWNSDGQGYIAISINPPYEAAGVKADEGDEGFDNGDASEYAVNDATLLLFTGESEDVAVFHSAYEMTLSSWGDGDNQQITSTTKLTQEINQINGSKIYALVVLNSNGQVKVGETDEDMAGATTVTIGSKTYSGGTDKWSDMRTAELTETNDNTLTGNGLFMTNAPLADKPGGSSDPTDATTRTLSLVKADKIEATAEEAASSDPAVTFYVERAVAKVSLKSSVADKKIQVGDESFAYEILGWGLDITNKATYAVHDISGASEWIKLKNSDLGTATYRFVSDTQVSTDDAEYRLYWGEDMNYSPESSSGDFNIAGGRVTDAEKLTENKLDDILYCFENTFNLANMTEEQVTRAIVRAELDPGEGWDSEDGFYIEGSDKSTIYKKEDAMALIKSKLTSNPGFVEWVQKQLPEQEITEADITIETDATELGKGHVSVSKITVTKNGQATEADKKFLEVANGGVQIYYYKDFISYYSVYLKHFSESETPWNEEVHTPGNPSYDSDAKYLGRYGVLRNNWYELNITGIGGIGDPVVPPIVPGRPVDEVEAYISAKINILSWAKRSQNVEL